MKESTEFLDIFDVEREKASCQSDYEGLGVNKLKLLIGLECIRIGEENQEFWTCQGVLTHKKLHMQVGEQYELETQI